ALAWPESHKGTFSVTDWMQSAKAKRRVIVQGHPQFEVVGAPLCHALMSLMTDLHLSLDTSRPCYLILDELAQFPHSPSLMR
ncbi:type IV secretion system DNA-binding domain-containing protein, partial [Pseudoalteromonas piscicida]